MKRVYFWLFIILFVATFLRFFQLGTNPPSLTWDEVAWGYNAYSLGIDGKDEFGRFLPLDYLESFGDFKPPLYAYLDIVPVKIFGLNEFSTRFPSAFFGVFTVFITYFLVKAIFGQGSEKIALAASLFLAISPWHINLSRAAFEANVSSFFIILGVLLFLSSMRKNKWLLILSVSSFILSLYVFNTARIISPLLLGILFLGFRNEILKRKKVFLISVIVGLVLISPVIRFLFTPQASLRFKEVNIFSSSEVVETSNQEIINDNNAPWSKIIHNRRVGYGLLFLKHYFDNLSPNFLFIKGDGNPKFSTQDVGQMYLWDLSFLIIGFLILFHQKKNYWWIIPSWLFMAILPAATARETPHALRIETAIPTFQIITAVGFSWFVGKLTDRNKRIIMLSVFALLGLNFLYYYHGYYSHYPRIFSGEWQYGYKESIDYVRSNKDKYNAVSITDQLGRPYIYYLFYSKQDPNIFRSGAKVHRDTFGFVTVEQLDKYYFSKDPNSITSIDKNVLFINTPKGVPEKAKILKTFYLLNGTEALVAYTL